MPLPMNSETTKTVYKTRCDWRYPKLGHLLNKEHPSGELYCIHDLVGFWQVVKFYVETWLILRVEFTQLTLWENLRTEVSQLTKLKPFVAYLNIVLLSILDDDDITQNLPRVTHMLKPTGVSYFATILCCEWKGGRDERNNKSALQVGRFQQELLCG